MTGPAKIDHVSAKNCRFLACLLYHNLITIYTTATKSSSLLQNLIDVLLQLTEWDSAFGTKDISENIICTHMVDFRRPGHICVNSLMPVGSTRLKL